MRSYRHVGSAPLTINGEDIMPGQGFVADLSPEQEAWFIHIGALEIVTPVASTPVPAEADSDEGQES